MAFTNIMNPNPTTHENSEAGIIIKKLNQLFQIEGNDIKISLSADGENFIRYNTADAQIEFYIADTLEGHVSAAEILAD